MWADTNKLFFNTNPIDKNAAESAVTNLYNYCHQQSLDSKGWKGYISTAPASNPKIVFVDGPTELAEKIGDEKWTALDRFNTIAHFVSRRGCSSKDRVHSVVCQIFHKVPYKKGKRCFDGPLFEPIDHLYNNDRPTDWEKLPNDHATQWEKLASIVWEQTYVCFTFQDVCYVVNRPMVVNSNERGLHCKDGPAIVFRDGTEIYCHEGELTTEKNVRHPEQMTLKDIHQDPYRADKHILIDLCGVERYLELCKAWKPDVKGKFQKFFSMSKMVLPEKPDAKEWEHAGYGHMYVDQPSSIKFTHGDVNGQYALCLKGDHDLYAFWDYYNKHVFDWKHHKKIFNEGDRDLWDLLNVNEIFRRGSVMGLTVAFQNGVFSVKSNNIYGDGFKSCRHEVAPAWFKAKMFRGEDALYENHTLNYAVKYENGKLLFGGDIEEGGSCTPANESDKPLKIRHQLFSGSEELPTYNFNIDLQSDSWEGLLEKWSMLSFEWLGMHTL